MWINVWGVGLGSCWTGGQVCGQCGEMCGQDRGYVGQGADLVWPVLCSSTCATPVLAAGPRAVLNHCIAPVSPAGPQSCFWVWTSMAPRLTCGVWVASWPSCWWASPFSRVSLLLGVTMCVWTGHVDVSGQSPFSRVSLLLGVTMCVWIGHVDVGGQSPFSRVRRRRGTPSHGQLILQWWKAERAQCWYRRLRKS